MSETKFTKGEWVADIRGGCCAVYEKSREEDTSGCHSTDDRNIYYSNLHAKYDGNRWHMSPEAIANAHLIAAAPEMHKLLSEIKQVIESGHELGEMVSRVRGFGEEIDELLKKARGKQ